MRTTVTIDDRLLDEAQRRVQAPNRTVLIQRALQALVRESAQQRLIEAAGSMPNLRPARRRRPQ